MGNLLDHVADAIISRRLFRRRQRILVAVSGGVDSMVLLHVLRALSANRGWRLNVAHYNHRLRGRSSDADERLVKRTAQRLDLPVTIERGNVRAFARQNKLSIEMAARGLRHEFLARTAGRLKIPAIALAHHADDQLELFFLRLLRGSGGEGLAGMKWRDASPANSTIELVRPLLDQAKQALKDYATDNCVTFREDASNASLDIKRNRIRRELLPLLRKHYQPALDRILLRVMEILGADAEFVAQAAADWLAQAPPSTLIPPRSADFAASPVAMQRRCVQLQLLNLGIRPEFEIVEQLRMKSDELVNLPGPCPMQVLRDGHGRLHLQKRQQAISITASRTIRLARGSGELSFDGVRVQWRIESKRGAALPKTGGGREFFDADQVGASIVLRHWRPGDRFQPIGAAQTVKLQDFFTNQKVLRRRRHELLLAATARGEVFWVEGMRISERFKLSKTTIRRLQWGWLRL